MLTEISENGKSVQYSYNEDGSLAQETDQNGNKVSFEYDNRQNLVSITVEDKNEELIGVQEQIDWFGIVLEGRIQIAPPLNR